MGVASGKGVSARRGVGVGIAAVAAGWGHLIAVCFEQFNGFMAAGSHDSFITQLLKHVFADIGHHFFIIHQQDHLGTGQHVFSPGFFFQQALC